MVSLPGVDSTRIYRQLDSDDLAPGSSTALPFTPPTDGHVTYAHCIVGKGAKLRVLATGTNPTSTTGIPYSPGDEFVVVGADDISNFRVIAESGTGELTAIFYGE